MIEKIVRFVFLQGRKKKRGRERREIKSEMCVVAIQMQWMTNTNGKKSDKLRKEVPR